MMRPTRATRKWCVEFMVGSDLQWSRSAGFLRHFFTNHAGKVLNRLYADMRSHSFTLWVQMLVGGLEHEFYFSIYIYIIIHIYIWDNPSHWLFYFSRWLKPPARMFSIKPRSWNVLDLYLWGGYSSTPFFRCTRPHQPDIKYGPFISKVTSKSFTKSIAVSESPRIIFHRAAGLPQLL